MMKRAVLLSTLLVALAATASAQIITIRSVPVAQGDQFDFFPSHHLGMGGVSIALADTLLDPFSNPAKGARLGAARFFGSPGLYTVSSEAGSGRTLPLGAFAQSGSWYGGLALALQEVDASRRPGVFPGPVVALDILRPDVLDSTALQLGPVEQSHGNSFAFAMLGKVLPAARLSFGGSLLWSGLHAVDGVDLLYAGSERIKQFGHAVDVRLGVVKEWAGDRSLEVVVVHNRFGMTHDVTYLDRFWDPGSQRVLQRPRLEHNLDRTNTWGLHLEYERPLEAPGWRIGWLATVNRQSHPKIPNYEIMSIPRDPGYSSAFNVGIGVARTYGPATFGIDAIYEPIWSHTWADAAGPVVTRLGATIPAGGKTIENDFRFSNVLFRMGAGRELPLGELGRAALVQFGLIVHSIGYRLEQYDNVQIRGRSQQERWVEWTPTWGLSLRFPELEIRYRGRVTKGTGRPGVARNNGDVVFGTADAARGGGIIVAPSGPLTLDPVSVATHQVSLSLPLR
jgi:hypothetical protein